MIKCFMKDLLGWMQGEYLETRDIGRGIKLCKPFWGKFRACRCEAIRTL